LQAAAATTTQALHLDSKSINTLMRQWREGKERKGRKKGLIQALQQQKRVLLLDL
jgi:hypothetical protein